MSARRHDINTMPSSILQLRSLIASQLLTGNSLVSLSFDTFDFYFIFLFYSSSFNFQPQYLSRPPLDLLGFPIPQIPTCSSTTIFHLHVEQSISSPETILSVQSRSSNFTYLLGSFLIHSSNTDSKSFELLFSEPLHLSLFSSCFPTLYVPFIFFFFFRTEDNPPSSHSFLSVSCPSPFTFL